MIWIYRLLLVPIAALVLPLAALFNEKIAEGMRLRRKRRVYPKFESRPFWIHASSGEFEYAKSVIRELKTRNPMAPVVVTYFSPTYARNVENFPGVDFALPLPLDLPGPVRGFLKRVNPRVLLLARTDFWPELLSQCRARGIPTKVFSYTQKKGAGLFTRWRLKMIDEIDCVSPEDRSNLEILGVKTHTQVLGDTRYDQVRYRLDHPKELPARLKPTDGRPCLIAGSTWPEDEKVLLPALAPLLKAKKLRLILAPPEPTPEHLQSLREQFHSADIDPNIFSNAESWDQVLIVDKVGWLAELYAWGDLAFVGGSFKRTVHSVMEPLGAGLKTFVGPLHTNNREAIEFQSVMGAVKAVENAEQLRVEVEALSLAQLRAFKPALQKEFAARLGATKKLVDLLTL